MGGKLLVEFWGESLVENLWKCHALLFNYSTLMVHVSLTMARNAGMKQSEDMDGKLKPILLSEIF